MNTSLAAKPAPKINLADTALSSRYRKAQTQLAGTMGSVAPSQHDQLVKQAQTWVATTFFGAMLKQMRNSPFKSSLFEGGRGGEAFGEMFDQKLAERMSRGAGQKIVKTIVRRIEAGAAYHKQAKPASSSTSSDSYQRQQNPWSSLNERQLGGGRQPNAKGTAAQAEQPFLSSLRLQKSKPAPAHTTQSPVGEQIPEAAQESGTPVRPGPGQNPMSSPTNPFKDVKIHVAPNLRA